MVIMMKGDMEERERGRNGWALVIMVGILVVVATMVEAIMTKMVMVTNDGDGDECW